MKILPTDKAMLRRRILRLNILLAGLVFLVSFVLTITGEYSTLQERQAADNIYNVLMIGSLLYMAGTWLFCVFSKPFWFPLKRENK